jgi:hypothetical protein
VLHRAQLERAEYEHALLLFQYEDLKNPNCQPTVSGVQLHEEQKEGYTKNGVKLLSSGFRARAGHRSGNGMVTGLLLPLGESKFSYLHTRFVRSSNHARTH